MESIFSEYEQHMFFAIPAYQKHYQCYDMIIVSYQKNRNFPGTNLSRHTTFGLANYGPHFQPTLGQDSEELVCCSIFWIQTPAKPLVKHARITAPNPQIFTTGSFTKDLKGIEKAELSRKISKEI